jgi:predicted RNase H-like HicB family nuclease
MQRTENYTARYIKIPSGYMGQLLEWPEVVTEGKNLEDCRESLKDALQQMILAYNQLGQEIPKGSGLFEPIPVLIN